MICEICCGDSESLYAAAVGGARRIELCSALAEGGATPSIGLIRQAVALGIAEVNVLIRPRKGDFLYTQPEIELMIDDIRAAVAAGATGVVIGALTADGNIDQPSTRSMIQAAQGRNITFHRAFDLCKDPYEALETVIALGCTSLLTSGQAASAMEGAQLIAQLVEQAGNRITVMAGAGVRPSNVAALIAATDVKAVHGTARAPRPSMMTFRRDNVPMGAPGEGEYTRVVTSAAEVELLIKNASVYQS